MPITPDTTTGAAGGDAAALGTAAYVDTGTSSGNVPLLSTGGRLPIARIASGTPDGTKFVRDDGSLVTPSGGSGSVATDTIFDAKGDLAVGTGADTAAKLTVGANDTVHVADSTQTTGQKWALLTASNLSSSAGVALSQLATQSNNSLVGNNAGSTAAPTALSVNTVRAMLNSPTYAQSLTASGTANNATEQTLYTWTIPANTLTTGDRLRLHVTGELTQNSGVTASVTPRVSFGGTSFSMSALAAANNANARGWIGDFEFTFYGSTVAGVSGRFTTGPQGSGGSSNPPTAVGGTVDKDSLLAAYNFTVNLAASQVLAFSMQWSAANASSVFNGHQAAIQVLRV